jgi:E3 ubiquitin-protein ligase ATL4
MSSSSVPSPTPPSIGGASPHSASSSFLPSFMIIAALLAFVFLASVAIHLLLRFLSHRSSLPPLPRTQQRDEAVRSAGTTAAANDGKEEEAPCGDEKQRLIDSLPLFTMASALAALPKSSPDCAVCLSPFTPDAELRLLPACRHAFHAACVDAWLRTTPSCPLCRAAVALPHPSLSGMLAAVHQQQAPRRSRDRSGSFVVEIGTVRGSSPLAGGGDSRNSRTYSLGSFDYQIDEEVQAVVSRFARPTQTIRDVMAKEEKPDVEEAPCPPGETVVEAAGSSRGWLWEYVDRLASTAYTFPGRWSTRSGAQSHHQTQNARQEEPWLWDTQAAAEMSSAPGSDEEETAFMVLYRWIAGV